MPRSQSPNSNPRSNRPGYKGPKPTVRPVYRPPPIRTGVVPLDELWADLEGLLRDWRDDAVEAASDGIADAWYRATNVYMVPGDPSSYTDPANPPPGPLKKRTYNLARAVKIEGPNGGDATQVFAFAGNGPGGTRISGNFGPPGIEDGNIFTGALYVDLSMAPYGEVHEYGGYVDFTFKDMGKQHGRKMRSSGYIEARPFIAPAMRDMEVDLMIDLAAIERKYNSIGTSMMPQYNLAIDITIPSPS